MILQQVGQTPAYSYLKLWVHNRQVHIAKRVQNCKLHMWNSVQHTCRLVWVCVNYTRKTVCSIPVNLSEFVNYTCENVQCTCRLMWECVNYTCETMCSIPVDPGTSGHSLPASTTAPDPHSFPLHGILHRTDIISNHNM